MPTRVGVYDSEFCGSFYVEVALTCMEIPHATFGDDDLRENGFGERYSALVFGAGRISGAPTAFGGTAGRKRIRNLIREGRTYIGICAGAYLALSDEPGGLGLVKQELEHPQAGNIFQGFLTVDYPHGSGTRFPLWYQNGPVFPRDADGVQSVFTSEQNTHRRSSTNSLTPQDFAQRPAAVGREYGDGRCILLAGHPELGSIGLTRYGQLITSWMQQEFPEDYREHPNRLPTGTPRRRFLNALHEVGISAELSKPQWAMFRDLIAGG